MSEQIGTRSKKVRGMAKRSIDLIEAMQGIAEQAHPITGRGVGYKLFTAGLIPDMGKPSMKTVYRLLKLARESGDIPWQWIVDETRDLEITPSWSDPAEFVNCAMRQYRRDFWQQQPKRVEVWSEKGTVRGVLAPILDEFGVGFRVMHGFSGATTVYDVAQACDGRLLIVLYVGDFDPSGMFMSEVDLPSRLEKYGGTHVMIWRLAVNLLDISYGGIPTFPASDKKSDPRYQWFAKRYGDTCAELDALDPNDLRKIVREAIEDHIEPEAWKRCVTVNEAERESLTSVLSTWGKAAA